MVSTAVAYDIVARDRASKAFRDVANSASASQKRLEGVSRAVKRGAAVIGGAAVAGAAVFVKNAVSLEAQFSKTMNLTQAASGASGKQMRQLSGLAIKMGRDTVFSASDAADAILELSKGGLKPATIQAGALRAAMNLAAAGQMDMGTAANAAVKAMGAFGLKGKQANQIANALAGAANASAADVSDLSLALAQAGAGAHQVGFSIQETTAALAAFSNAGVNGSDAGTSLKTMLQRLQPTTKAASLAMQSVGLFSKKTGSQFVKANGDFKSLAQIAGILHDKLGGLTKAQQQQALTSIFGSDASRAATILMNEGAKGIKKYEKATSDQTAAQKMAQAGMKGTAGAIEQLKGSLETVELQFGRLAAPYVQAGLKMLTTAANNFGTKVLPKVAEGMRSFMQQVKTGQGPIGELSRILKAVAQVLGTVLGWMLRNKTVVGTFVGIIGAVVIAIKAWRAAQIALDIVLSANPLGLVVVAVAALAAGLVYAYKHSKTFRDIVQGAFKAISTAASFMWDHVLKPVFKLWLNAWFTVVGGILNGAAKAFGWVPGIGPKLKTAAEKFKQFRDAANRALDGVHKNITLNVTANYSASAKRIMKAQGLTGTGYVAAGNLLAGKRALGGPVAAGRAYLVGERGPEVFTTAQSGRIIPNGGKTVNINIDKLQPHDYGDFMREMQQRERRASLGVSES